MERLKVSEAAKLAGASASTIRRWIQLNRLQATRNSVGDWEVERDALMGLLAQQPLPPTTQAPAHAPPNDSDALRLALAALEREKESLERERRIADDLRAELREARAEIRGLQAEMHALLTGGLEAAVSRWVRVSTEGKPSQPPTQQEATHLEAQEEPKTDFGKRCYELFKQNKTDEEIAEELHKPISNVRMVLRKFRSHSNPKCEN